MKKNKTKSMLACAVLASVLAGGVMPSVEASTYVSNLQDSIGRIVYIGKKHTVEDKELKSDGLIGERTAGWEIVNYNNGTATLLAKTSWGYGYASDRVSYDDDEDEEIPYLLFDDVLGPLRKGISNIFNEEERKSLQGDFCLPSEEDARNSSSNEFWVNNYIKRTDVTTHWSFIQMDEYLTFKKWYDVMRMDDDHELSMVEGYDEKNNYLPEIHIGRSDAPVMFVTHTEKTSDGQITPAIPSLNPDQVSRLTLYDANLGKVNIKDFHVDGDGISLTDSVPNDRRAGILESQDGHYVAYAGAARQESTINPGTIDNITDRFDINTYPGTYTLHVFNERVTSGTFDYAGDFRDFEITLNNGKVTALVEKGARVYDTLALNDVDYSVKQDSKKNTGLTLNKGFEWKKGVATCIDITGKMVLGGEVSIINGNNSERPQITLTSTAKSGNIYVPAIPNNNITFIGATGVIAADISGTGMTIDGTSVLRVEDGTTFNIKVDVGGSLELSGNSTFAEDLAIKQNGILKLASGMTLTESKYLYAEAGSKIIGADSTSKLNVDGNIVVNGDFQLDKVTASVGKKVVINENGNLKGTDSVTLETPDMTINGSIQMDGILKVKNTLNSFDGKATTGSIKNLYLGENGDHFFYSLDLGKDVFEISNKAEGNILLVVNSDDVRNNPDLKDGAFVNVFTGDGNLDSLRIRTKLFTNKDDFSTFALVQNQEQRGQVAYKELKNRTTVDVLGMHAGKIVFGNYFQDNDKNMTPVVWSWVKEEEEDTGKIRQIYLSDKILEKQVDVDVRPGSSFGALDVLHHFSSDSYFYENLFTSVEKIALAGISEDLILRMSYADDVKDGGNYGWQSDAQRKAQYTAYCGPEGQYYVVFSGNLFGDLLVWVDGESGKIVSADEARTLGDGEVFNSGIRPEMALDEDTVLFATNVENGKGACDLGEITRLKSVDGSSTLELTLDDVYVAHKAGAERLTGDVSIGGDIKLEGSSVKLNYRNAKHKDENSYIAAYVGEEQTPEDYFGYGRAARVDKNGYGELTLNLGNYAQNLTDGNLSKGMALSFVNEYGRGTSLAGDFCVLPGTFRADVNGNVLYTVAVDKLRGDIAVGADNVVNLIGHKGEISAWLYQDYDTLSHKISGEGTVKIEGLVTAIADKVQANFIWDGTYDSLLITGGGEVTGSVMGNWNLFSPFNISGGDVTFSGTRLQGYVQSLDNSKLILNSDLDVTGNLTVFGLEGTPANGSARTLKMAQIEQSATYDELNIGKLHSNAFVTLDADLKTLESDKIHLQDVSEDTVKLILKAVNIVDEPEDMAADKSISLKNVASGTKIANIVTADEDGVLGKSFKVATDNFIYKVELVANGEKPTEDKDLQITCLEANTGGINALFGSDSTSKFMSKSVLQAVTEPAINVYSAHKIMCVTSLVVVFCPLIAEIPVVNGPLLGTPNVADSVSKTINMNGNAMTGKGNDGFVIGKGCVLDINGGTGSISGFGTAFEVQNGGTLNLQNVAFTDNTTDVKNAGNVHVYGTVNMQTLTGSGTTDVTRDSVLNIVSVDKAQNLTGFGTLNLLENITLAVEKLGVNKTNIAQNKCLTLVGGNSDATRNNLKTILGGSGSMKITSGNYVAAEAEQLQTAVENNGNLQIGINNEIFLTSDITGEGTVEFAKSGVAKADISQAKIVVKENVLLDTYGKFAAGEGIENKGVLEVTAGNLSGNVTNTGDGSFRLKDLDWENGAVYLYGDNTPDSQVLNANISGGKVIVMDNIKTVLANLDADVYISEDSTLILTDNLGEEKTIEINIKGYEALASGLDEGTGTLETGGKYKIKDSKVQVPICNTGEITFTDSNEIRYTLSGSGKYTNAGTLTVLQADNLLMPELENTAGTVVLGDGVLYAKIKDGTLNINGEVMANADNIVGTTNTVAENKNLLLTNGTLTKGIGGQGTTRFVGDVTVATGVNVSNAYFAEGSITNLTVSDGGNAPLNVTDSITVDGGAKLYLTGAEKNKTYKIVAGNAITNAFTGWTLSNIRGEDANGRKVKGMGYSIDDSDHIYSVSFKSTVPGNTDIAKLLDNAEGPLMDWAENIADYFDAIYGDAGDIYTANAINSMTSASVLAGAQKGAATMVTQVAGNISANVGVGARPSLTGGSHGSGLRNVSADVNDAASLRPDVVETGLASEVMPSAYKEKVYDKQVWASYIHSKQKIDGLKAGSLIQNSTVQLNGVTLGVDLWSDKKSFGGIALTYADGNTNSAQMSNSTKNEAKYYGISMYHRQDTGKYALTTDIGYTYNKNDVTQSTFGTNGEITSKPKSDAYTAGLKLEREIYLSNASKIIPFVGARYTRLQNRDFSNNKGAVTKVDNQNLVTVPVGLSLNSHLITTEGWKLGSILEGGYEWNFGDRHSTQKFGYGGAYSTIGFDVADKGQYFAKAALTAEHKNMFFELGYRYSKGKSVRDNRWNVNLSYMF